MNPQIHYVISDITGLTGLRIIDAVLAGERNPMKQRSRICVLVGVVPRQQYQRGEETVGEDSPGQRLSRFGLADGC